MRHSERLHAGFSLSLVASYVAGTVASRSALRYGQRVAITAKPEDCVQSRRSNGFLNQIVIASSKIALKLFELLQQLDSSSNWREPLGVDTLACSLRRSGQSALLKSSISGVQISRQIHFALLRVSRQLNTAKKFSQASEAVSNGVESC